MTTERLKRHPSRSLEAALLPALQKQTPLHEPQGAMSTTLVLQWAAHRLALQAVSDTRIRRSHVASHVWWTHILGVLMRSGRLSRSRMYTPILSHSTFTAGPEIAVGNCKTFSHSSQLQSRCQDATPDRLIDVAAVYSKILCHCDKILAPARF